MQVVRGILRNCSLRTVELNTHFRYTCVCKALKVSTQCHFKRFCNIGIDFSTQGERSICSNMIILKIVLAVLLALVVFSVSVYFLSRLCFERVNVEDNIPGGGMNMSKL